MALSRVGIRLYDSYILLAFFVLMYALTSAVCVLMSLMLRISLYTCLSPSPVSLDTAAISSISDMNGLPSMAGPSSIAMCRGV